MNKVYKVVWNASLGIWVAVSEIAKGKTKSSCLNEEQHNNDNSITKPKQDKLFLLKPLAYSIIIAFFPLAVNAATGDGGGTRTGGAGTSNTAISPTSAQCNVLGFSQSQATVDGANTIQSVAIGCGSLVGATNTTSQQIGDRRGGTDPVAYPSGETGYRSAGTAIGNRNSTAGGGGLAIGTGNASTGDFYGVAVGQGNNADAYGVAVGIGNLSNSTSAVAIGTANQATGNTAVAVGRQSYAKGDNSIALGNVATSDGKSSIAIGDTSLSTTVDSISIGRNAKSGFGGSNDIHAIAIGADSTSYAYGIALGNGATADQSGFTSTNGGIAIGSAADTAAGTLSGVAIGNSAKVTGSATNSVAVGKDANASVNNSVALGAGSTTTAQSGSSFLTNVAASVTNGVVSVGTTSATRRIQNVADGAADQDAVTVAQLKDVNNRAVGNTTALGGGAAYDPSTNVYTAPTFTTTKTDGTTVNSNTVSGALTNLNNEVVKPITFNGNTGTSTNKLGSTLNITGGLTGASSNANVKTVITGNTLDIQIANAPTFTGTVTAGNLATGGTLSVTGVSNLNGGANLNNQKITNVAAGTASGDAVNFGQLTTTNNNVTTAQNAANAAQTSANAAQTTANSALTEAQKGLNFRANAGATDKVSLGETVTLADGTNTTVTYDAATNTYKYSVVNAPTFTGTVTAGNLATGGTLSVTGVSNLNGGANLNNQKITNVAAGTASGDVVNFGQLTTTNNNVTTAQNAANAAQTSANAAQTTANSALTEAQKGINFGDGSTSNNYALGETINVKGDSNINSVTTADGVQLSLASDISVDSVTTGNSKLDNSGLVITGGPSITTTGIDAGSKVISNVADGSVAAGSKDAVNGGQLFTTNQNVSTNATNIATNTSNIATNTSNIATNTSNIATNTTDISNLQGQTFKLQANGDTASAVASSDTVQFIDGDNIDITRSGNDITIATSKDLTVDSVTAGNSKLDTTGLVITGGPSITTTGIDAGSKVISNVADGSVAAGSKDAVNGGQLFTTNQNVSTNATNIATNTSNIATNTSNIATNTSNIATNTTDISNLQGQTFKLQANGDTASAVASSDTVQFIDGDNIDITRSGNDITIATSKDLTVDSVTAGNSKLDTTGLVITGGPSITTTGIDAANTNISNVADATTADQAVNKGQLDAATAAADDKTDALGNSTANNLGGGATYNSTTGAVTAPTYSVNGTDVNNVGDAITELDKGWNLASNGANAGAIKAGDTVDIGTAAGESNLQVTKSGNTIQYSLSR
ncbi:ESPR-type extended signal peptide-containing protein, partial [Acinetobacter venetianus]|uniref:ESPR-type extended signal peptide-containing protein n=1 Tax=Acinetobacter venetianus TaxID=52133 RepID=UPI000AE0626C